MTPQRFAQLAEAYGADLQRWPVAERPAAQALLAGGDAQVLEAQRQASWLDNALDSHRLAAADPALARYITRSAGLTRKPSFWARYAGWLSPAGFLGAGVAGIAAGMLVASLSLPVSGGYENLPSIFDQGDADIVFDLNLNNSEEPEQ